MAKDNTKVVAVIQCPCGYTSTRYCRPDDPEHARHVFRALGWRFVNLKPDPPANDVTYFLRGMCEECWDLDHQPQPHF